MRVNYRWVCAWVFATSLCVGITDAGWAEGSGRIRASSSELVVDGWHMLLPTVSVDENTGQTWVRYDLPDGSYQSYPLADGELIAEKWFKPGVDGFNTTPGGYSIEDTEAIKNWWMDGGVGDFVVQDGNWTAIDPEDDQTDPAAADNSDATASAGPAATGSSDTDDEAGVFGGRVDPGAIQTVSTAEPNQEMNQLRANMEAARKLCQSEPSNDNCAKFYEAQRAYLERAGGN